MCLANRDKAIWPEKYLSWPVTQAHDMPVLQPDKMINVFAHIIIDLHVESDAEKFEPTFLCPICF